MEKYTIDQSDYINSAAIMSSDDGGRVVYAGACKSTTPCNSCGGGCYGCKGSQGAEVSLVGEAGLAQVVESILDGE